MLGRGTRRSTAAATASASASLSVTRTEAAYGSLLGLADEVGSDVHRVGGVVGQHGDLGGAGLGVDADQALEQALGGRDVDVAGAGDKVDRLGHHRVLALTVGEAVGERGDPPGRRPRHTPRRHRATRTRRGRSGAGTRRRHRCSPAGAAGHRERTDLGDLRRDDVHDHARGVDRAPSGDVEADAVDRYPALGDRATLGDGGRRGRAALVLVDDPGAADRLLERGPHVGGQRVERGGDDVRRHAQAGRPDTVEALAEVVEGLGAAVADVLAQRAHGLDGGSDVELGAGKEVAQLADTEHASAQVDRGHHGPV